ncbi:MAG: Crp/Fnr family transcriptional regulator [Candidatus Bipolaricaulia bacterium]
MTAEIESSCAGQKNRFSELASFLASIFEGVTEGELEKLRDSVLCVQYDTNDLIIQEGSFFSGLYIVYKGLVKIGQYTPAGNTQIFRFLSPKEFLGRETLFMPEQQINIQYARALVDSELIFIEKGAFLHFLKGHPKALFSLCSQFSKQIERLVFKLAPDEENLQNLSLFLLALNDKYGIEVELGSKINPEIPRDTLTTVLEISDESLAQLLRYLRERNIISNERNTFTIIDQKKLEFFAKNTELRSKSWEKV